MDAAIVARLRQSDEAAFALLLQHYEAPLGRYLQSLTRSRDLAQDLVQETFLRAYTHLEDLRDDTAIRPWLYRIATNLAMTALKRRSRFQWLPWVAVAEPTTRFEDDLAERDAVQQAIAQLPVEYSSCLLLTRVEGLKSYEAAAVLGISAELVRKRVSRALELLRRELGEEDGHAV